MLKPSLVCTRRTSVLPFPLKALPLKILPSSNCLRVASILLCSSGSSTIMSSWVLKIISSLFRPKVFLAIRFIVSKNSTPKCCSMVVLYLTYPSSFKLSLFSASRFKVASVFCGLFAHSLNSGKLSNAY